MTFLLRVADRLARKAIGSIDAGACMPDTGCCCTPGVPNYKVDCYGNCVTSLSCSNTRSIYNLLCN